MRTQKKVRVSDQESINLERLPEEFQAALSDADLALRTYRRAQDGPRDKRDQETLNVAPRLAYLLERLGCLLDIATGCHYGRQPPA